MADGCIALADQLQHVIRKAFDAGLQHGEADFGKIFHFLFRKV